MASNSSKKSQQQSSLLSFFNKKPSESIIEKEVMTEQLAVKETASKPVKHHQQAPLGKKPSTSNDHDSMDVDHKTQDGKDEDDDDDDTPLFSKAVSLNL